MRAPSVMLFSIFFVACSLVSTPNTSPPQPTSAPTSEFSFIHPSLTSSAQNDIPLDSKATRYDLTLSYSPGSLSLQGTEDVHYTNRENNPLSELYFRLFANYPDSDGRIQVTRLDVDGVPAPQAYEAQKTALKATLSKPLAPGESVVAHLEFGVTVPRDSKQHYSDFTASDAVITLPTVYPLVPAYDSAGWHIEVPPSYGDLVYSDASFYVVTVTVPSEFSVIASGSTLGIRDNGDGTKTWSIVGGPMRDFDLNLSDRLAKVEKVVGETTVVSWYNDLDASSGKMALNYASNALQIFANRFGPYPYRELDVVETSTTAGGIEYPGVIVIGRSLYQDPGNRGFFEFATVHEVAHQWWYGVVGGDQVNFPWVDEALAQYSALVYWEDSHGADTGAAVLNQYIQGLYFRARAAGHDAPANQPVSAFSEPDYAAIVYGKAPLFYDAIRKKMGDAKFFQFLKQYYQSYRFGVAFPQDILKTAETSCGCSLQREYSNWILGPQK